MYLEGIQEVFRSNKSFVIPHIMPILNVIA